MSRGFSGVSHAWTIVIGIRDELSRGFSIYVPVPLYHVNLRMILRAFVGSESKGCIYCEDIEGSIQVRKRFVAVDFWLWYAIIASRSV